MKDTKAGQLIGLIIAAIFTGGMIYFINDSGSAAAIAMTFTGIVGIFIGLDIAVMIKRTSGMTMGFEEINKQRYITGLVIFSFLLAEAFFISGVLGRNCDSLYTSFGMGFLIIIGGLIAGVEGNKIVTKNDDPVSPEKQ
jgi:xanthosine utilization system XapX-like protein